MTMPNPARYAEVEVAGSPKDMGSRLGETAREAIRGFCEVALDRVQMTTHISRDKALAVAHQSTAYAERYSSDMITELRATAHAAGVTLDELMLLQVRNQLQAEQEAGCTALSITACGETHQGAVVAQNWDNDPVLDEFTIVLTRRPAGKPAFITCTQAGLISYLGFNDAGLGACVNTLPAPSRDIGVPHYFTLRGVYEATTLDAAVHAVNRAERAIPANIMLITPQGPADLEVTIDAVHVIQDGEHGWLTHTNHCTHPTLVRINDQFPELIQSHARKSRIDELLGQSKADTLESVKAALSDHQDFPRSICRHQNDDKPHGFWETVFSIIIEPSERRMHVSRGTPCDHPYETYLL